MTELQRRQTLHGHLFALISIVIWGTTYISTKILLESFTPVEILVIRFVMGYLFLWILAPHRLKTSAIKTELLFVGAGLSGMTVYYLLENVALTYTMASNVGVIIAAAPFLTSIFVMLIIKSEAKPRVNFYIGFVFAAVGIALISFNGTKLHFSPKGDLLAFLAAVAWAVYSVFMKKISELNVPVIAATRRIFFWGLLFMVPALFLFDFSPDIITIFHMKNLLNLI